MKELINIELRSRILEYALSIESLVNNLILMNLGIYNDKEKTRLFSTKGKMNFQSKIDLLYDIDILSKEENDEFGLLMIIRNRFLHDINCGSFQILFNQLDSGIVNRFKKFLEGDKFIVDEEACKAACYKLFKKNLDTIKKKIELNKIAIENKFKLIKLQNEQIVYYFDVIHELLKKISIATENAELEHPKVAILGEEILLVLQETIYKLNTDPKKINYEEFFNSNEKIKSIFGIKSGLKELPKWSDFKLSNTNNTDI